MREWPRYDNEDWPTPVPKPTISGTGMNTLTVIGKSQ